VYVDTTESAAVDRAAKRWPPVLKRSCKQSKRARVQASKGTRED